MRRRSEGYTGLPDYVDSLAEGSANLLWNSYVAEESGGTSNAIILEATVNGHATVRKVTYDAF